MYNICEEVKMRRKIYDKLLSWKEKETKPLIILGARQVGKTYIIDEFCRNEFENYKMVNLLVNRDIVDLYKENINSTEKFKQLKLLLNFDLEKDNSILFVDEAQESEEFISDLKFINENYPNIKIIVAGSLLGIKLKRLSKPFPVGKVVIYYMYPLDFEEFLMAIDRIDLINEIKEHYHSNQEMPNLIHNLLLNYYYVFLICGGMPENVKSYIDNKQDISKINSNILESISVAYIDDMKRYVKSNEESIKIGKIYRSIPSQLANNSRKFQYSKVEIGARGVNYESALNWLVNSGLVMLSDSIKNPEKPLKGYVEDGVFKIYLSDVGLLTRMLNLKYNDLINDVIGIYKGVIVENYVAQQFISNNIPLNYWRSTNIAEIDFLIENKDGVIPIEVKSSNNNKSKSLNTYINKFNPPYSIRISTKNFGYNDQNKIKSIPLYATFCVE